jgi:hypothetical protein
MTRWNENLVPRTAGGLSVVAAGPQDLHCVSRLFARYLAATAFRERGPDEARLQAWLHEILSSHLWLVLLLRSPHGQAQGFALAQYGGYEVDPEQRILRCRHLHVDPSVTCSLRSAGALLIDALVEAARRSPQVVDVFLITFGAQRLDALRRLCERRGFRRIGTQHLGLRAQTPHPPHPPHPPSPQEHMRSQRRPQRTRGTMHGSLTWAPTLWRRLRHRRPARHCLRKCGSGGNGRDRQLRQ